MDLIRAFWGRGGAPFGDALRKGVQLTFLSILDTFLCAEHRRYSIDYRGYELHYTESQCYRSQLGYSSRLLVLIVFYFRSTWAYRGWFKHGSTVGNFLGSTPQWIRSCSNSLKCIKIFHINEIPPNNPNVLTFYLDNSLRMHECIRKSLSRCNSKFTKSLWKFI